MNTMPLSIGSLVLPSPIIYAPLAGCSDYPFRKMARQFHKGLMYCEMVKMDPLVSEGGQTLQLLDYSEEMHPIGAQLCGSRPEYAKDSAQIIEELGFDTVDLNCGCPVDKVTKDGSGSGLLKSPHKIGTIIKNMVNSVSIPVTLKIRLGWDDDSHVCEQVTRIAEDCGAQAITIHGRTRQQAYRGDANWDPIAACKQIAKHIKVIGNGDIFCPQTATDKWDFAKTDGILIARGTMGQPWISEDIINVLSQQKCVDRSLQFKKEVLLRHINIIEQYQVPRRQLTDLKRISCWYMKHFPQAKERRSSLMQEKNFESAKQRILEWDFSLTTL